MVNINISLNMSHILIFHLNKNVFILFRTNPSYVPSIFPSLDDKNEESGTKPKKPEPKNKRNVKVSALMKEGKYFENTSLRVCP